MFVAALCVCVCVRALNTAKNVAVAITVGTTVGITVLYSTVPYVPYCTVPVPVLGPIWVVLYVIRSGMLVTA